MTNHINSAKNLQRSMKIYETKFDLASLESRTNETVTKQVEIKADTVFISEPITINYNLIIKARIVSLDHEISMKLTSGQFSNADFRTKYEKNVIFGEELTVRNRRFGLLTIIGNIRR